MLREGGGVECRELPASDSTNHSAHEVFRQPAREVSPYGDVLRAQRKPRVDCEKSGIMLRRFDEWTS